MLCLLPLRQRLPAPGALALADPGKRTVPAWLTGALLMAYCCWHFDLDAFFNVEGHGDKKSKGEPMKRYLNCCLLS